MQNINKERFNKLVRNFIHHRGLGGEEAHPTVDQWNSGFISPEMLKILENSSGKAEFMPDNTDVMTLPVGNYVTWSDDISKSNLPAKTGYLVEIKIWNKLKIIKAIAFGSGKSYIYSTNHNGVNPTSPEGWGRMYREHVLFDGALSGAGATTTLPERADLFEDLIVIYRHNKQNDGVAFLSTYNLIKYDLTISSVNIAGDMSGIMINEVRVKIDQETKKKFTILDSKSINFGPRHFNDTSQSDRVEILKIIGRL